MSGRGEVSGMREHGSPARVRGGAIALYTVLAWGLAWLICLPLWLGRGLATPGAVIILTAMMFAPTIAVVVTMLVTGFPRRGERLRSLGMWPLRPAKRVVWLTVIGWLGPLAVVLLGIGVAIVLGWLHPDFTFPLIAEQLKKVVPAGVTLPPIGVIVIAQLAAIPVGALFNGIFAFGEELGWRGWLVPALRPLGTWPALLISGAIWGIWHAPVILLGYDFGRRDVVGVLLMVGGCVAWGVLFGWLRLRSASLWPSVFAHGMLNASAGLSVLISPLHPNLALISPLGASGWIACAVVIAILLLTGQFRRQPALAAGRRKDPAPVASPPPAAAPVAPPAATLDGRPQTAGPAPTDPGESDPSRS
ncbi:type II CAAX endopeptidase family protein [Microbacterium capsulatum]|uniref:Type II CAAX endopeptidase family protein n=1 Tax=Microbacterium capsulatum TaxID=3041921 RepID=A0ABU0XJP4_9MICO|nr:type II CAAX endopeptidase family protein [Microbacterium sp. ASV81]MDQ4215365.1 type II CAAX endopeptidase family protein [Microbacterium sp. ASV81]